MCYVYHFYSLLTYCVIEISAVWYVLPYEAIGVCDATFLPWCMRISKGILVYFIYLEYLIQKILHRSILRSR